MIPMTDSQSILADDFFSVIENHEIINWESKDFWMKIDHTIHKNNHKNRQKIYNLIGFLSKNSCFDIKKSPTNKRIKLYTENEKLKHMRNTIIQENLNDILNEKYEQTLDNIRAKESDLNFLESLSNEYPSIRNTLAKYQSEYKEDIKALKSNINVIKIILDKKV